jgi:hypothetical protein
MHLRIEPTKLSFENGFMMPDTPTMDIPPTIPSLGLNVRAAISSPPGTETVTVRGTSGCNKAMMLLRIISRGTRFMAGLPGGKSNPGRVTVPTPGPEEIVIRTFFSWSGECGAGSEICF